MFSNATGSLITFRGYFSVYKEDYYSRAVHSWLCYLCKQSKFSFSPGQISQEVKLMAGKFKQAP